MIYFRANPVALLSKQRRPLLDSQVITDIDDTVKSSGGIAIAGIALGGVDTSYSRGSFYPGVFQFGLELSDHGSSWRNEVPKMAVLTARAIELIAFLEITPDSPLCKRYAAAAEARGGGQGRLAGWGVGEVLYGSVAEWIFQDRKGWRKFENFKVLSSDAPQNRRYVFIGDNGVSEKATTQKPHTTF